MFLLLIITPFYFYKIPQYYFSLQQLPSEIKATYPVAIGTEEDSVDGCDVTVLKLSESTIKKIEALCINFFDDAIQAQGRNHYDYRRYKNWKETPTLPIWKIDRGEDSPIKCAVIDKKLLNTITEAAINKGAYYTTNSEVELMILPALGFVVITDDY